MGGMLMARFGWRTFFVVLGLISLTWLWPWLKWRPREQGFAPASSMKAHGIFEILRLRSAWGTCSGLFCANYLNYFLITWLPFYLVRERHFSMDKMAKIAGAAYLSAAVFGTLCGWLSDRWIDAGGTPTRVRKTFTSVGMVCAATFLIVCVVSSPGLSIAMLILAVVSLSMCASNLWAITQTLAGPQTAGRWTGVQNFIGNLAGVVAPALTGLVLQRTGQFFWPFAITASVCLLGAMSWIFLVGCVQPVVWSPQRPEISRAAHQAQ